MSANPIKQLLVDSETQAKIAQQEQLRKAGCSFIRVAYVGRENAVRLHGFHNRGIRLVYNAETGQTEPEAFDDDRVVEFQTDPAGNQIAEVLDDQYNRYAISRNENLRVLDEKLAAEITQLANKPYSVEADRATELRRQKERLERELHDLELKEQAKAKEATPMVPEQPTTTVAPPAAPLSERTIASRRVGKVHKPDAALTGASSG